MKREHWLKLILPVVILVLWDMFTRFGSISPFILPDPLSIVSAFVEQTRNGEFYDNTQISLQRSLGGFLIGSLFGIGSGIVIGWSRFWEHLTDLPINFVRSIPKTAMAPLFIVWFGIGDISKILLIAFSSYFFTVIPTIEGVKNVDAMLVKSARSMGAGQWQILSTVILPASLPSIFAGMRLAVTTSLLVLVMVEIIAGNDGLGFMLEEARGNLNMATLFATLFLLGLLGYALDGFMQFLGSILMPWRKGKTLSV